MEPVPGGCAAPRMDIVVQRRNTVEVFAAMETSAMANAQMDHYAAPSLAIAEAARNIAKRSCSKGDFTTFRTFR